LRQGIHSITRLCIINVSGWKKLQIYINYTENN
jgi:hypothetical protein